MPYDTEHDLLTAYQTAMSTLSTATHEQWRQAMEPLIHRTIALLRQRTGDTTFFTLHELIPRFAQEDIEVFADITISTTHPNVDAEGNEFDEPLLNAAMTMIHYPGNDEVNATQIEDNLTLLEVAAKFGLDPDAPIWQVMTDI